MQLSSRITASARGGLRAVGGEGNDVAAQQLRQRPDAGVAARRAAIDRIASVRQRLRIRTATAMAALSALGLGQEGVYPFDESDHGHAVGFRFKTANYRR